MTNAESSDLAPTWFSDSIVSQQVKVQPSQPRVHRTPTLLHLLRYADYPATDIGDLLRLLDGDWGCFVMRPRKRSI